eukprot:Gb_28146 [translate_table: standard]
MHERHDIAKVRQSQRGAKQRRSGLTTLRNICIQQFKTISKPEAEEDEGLRLQQKLSTGKPRKRMSVTYTCNGRYTNRKTILDIIAQELGLNTFAPPYLAPSTNGVVLTKGVNFACSSGGILTETGGIFLGIADCCVCLLGMATRAGRMSSMASGAEKESSIARKQVMSERFSGKVVMKRPEKKSKKAKRDIESYMVYICGVLKQVHLDIGISSKAMSIMNTFVNYIFEKIVYEASKLARYSQRHTINSREIQTSVRLVLPGELAKHVVSEGTNIVTKFSGV